MCRAAARLAAARATIYAVWSSTSRVTCDAGATPAYPLSRNDHRLVFLRRAALLCAVLVLAVTSLSAYIRLSKVGLGCADWPQCYGQSLRQLQQGVVAGADEPATTVAARLAHRVTAVCVLLMAVTMAMACFGTRPVLRAEGAMALALLGLALFLAVLGRWSSGARVPAVTMGNLLGGFAMLALCARLAMAGHSLPAPGLRAWVVVAMFLLLAQVALGGLVSASFAGLSCDDWAGCMQAARSVDWETLEPWREPVLGAQPPINPAGALAHWLHRASALALVPMLAALAIAALLRCRPCSAMALLAMLGAQAAVGVLMVQESLPLGLALLHNMLAAGLLAMLVLLF